MPAVLQQGPGIFGGAEQQYDILGPGQGHVEHPDIFRHLLRRLFSADELKAERIGVEPRSRLHQPHRGAERLVEIRLAAAGLAELLAQARRQHKRKFQSFALVDGHDADHVLAFRQDLYLAHFHLTAPAVDRIDVADKAVKPGDVVRFELLSLIHQRPQIGKALGACRNGGGKHRISAVRKQFPEKIAQGHVAGEQMPAVQLLGKREALFL